MGDEGRLKGGEIGVLEHHEDGQDSRADVEPAIEVRIHVAALENRVVRVTSRPVEVKVHEDPEAVADGHDLSQALVAEGPERVRESGDVEAEHDDKGSNGLDHVEDWEDLGPKGVEGSQHVKQPAPPDQHNHRVDFALAFKRRVQRVHGQEQGQQHDPAPPAEARRRNVLPEPAMLDVDSKTPHLLREVFEDGGDEDW
eukprot:902243-Rhodomonas_salina.1